MIIQKQKPLVWS